MAVSFRVLNAGDLPETPTDDLGLVAGGKAFVAPGKVGYPELRIGLPLKVRRCLGEVAKPLLAEAQVLQRLVPPGDVGDGDDKAPARFRMSSDLDDAAVRTLPFVAKGLMGTRANDLKNLL